VSLSNGKGDAQDVLLVDGMKHNFLSGSQMCDRVVKWCSLPKIVR
jgi:hypothetical protein